MRFLGFTLGQETNSDNNSVARDSDRILMIYANPMTWGTACFALNFSSKNDREAFYRNCP